MERLPELDASLLYLEHETCPMHTGGIYLFEAPAGLPPLNFDEVRALINKRIQSTTRFRQRLVEVPFNLDVPCWVDDPDFNLDNHLMHITLDAPVTPETLMALAESRQSQMLDRSRPLWDMVFVDSHTPENRLTGLLVRTHQVLVNSASGDELMSALLDPDPDSPRTLKPAKWSPQPLPSRARLLGKAYSHAVTAPMRLAGMARDTVASSVYAMLMQRLRQLPLPVNLLGAPDTPFNQPITAARALDTATIPLHRLKHIKQMLPPANLNDILLALAAEIAREELIAHGALPAQPLTALSPVSVRSKRLDSPTGSQLSAMLVSLDTHIDNLAERTLSIHAHAEASHVYSEAVAAARLTHMMPSALMGLAARIYSEFQLAQKHRPIFNLPITNIPGPTSPLYLLGQPLARHIACAPLYDRQACAFVFVSDATQVTLSLTYCPERINLTQPLQQRLDQALHRLESEAETCDPDTLLARIQARHMSEAGSGWLTDITRLFEHLLQPAELKKLYDRARARLGSG